MYQSTTGLLSRSLLLLCSAFIFFTSQPLFADGETPRRGVVTGGVPHAVPDWFKDSFLDIQEDVEEATENNRHVILFFQLNDCPYCDRMLRESFEAEPLKSMIQDNFDVIAINVKGDRDIAFNESVSVTEKELSEKLEVRATPAILFLNSENNAVVRVDGYRSPKRFQHVLSYVRDKAYAEESLAAYLDKSLEKGVYQLRDHPLFQPVTDLSASKTPLMVIFEDDRCDDCAEFHDKLLSREDVQTELKAFTVVRLDTDSDQEITDPEGKKTTAKAWADSMQMTYRPGVLVYDEGTLQRRIDSLLYSFHFKEGLRYIGGGFYKKQDYRSYSEQRREELLAAGVDINLGE